MSRRVRSYVWGGVAGIFCLVLGIVTAISVSDFLNFVAWGTIGVLSFTFISCLLLKNNFIGDMVLEIFSWGFIRMPGLIFTLDLDGIIWLITVKLALFVLGIALALVCGLFGVILGMLLSLFVYPYALYKNIKYGEDAESVDL